MITKVTFTDWEDQEAPNNSDLKKESLYLNSSDFTTALLATDSKVKKVDDATWLYLHKKDGSEETELLDKRGHKGTKEDPYEIYSAMALASFYKEVENGKDFKGKYVKLATDLSLQPSSEFGANNSDKVTWPGIKNFNGTLDGGGHIIKNLYGKPLFLELGEAARVSDLRNGYRQDTGKRL